MSDINNEKFLNLHYALADEKSKDVVPTNAGNFRISIFLTKKWEYKDDDLIDLDLKYNDVVINLYLEDDLNSIGMRGYIDVRNTSSYLDMYLGKIENFYVVINITEFDNDNVPKVKYEPYIFSAVYVKNLSAIDSDNKVLRVGLEDCITNILKTHSFANLLKEKHDIYLMKSYKDVFSSVLDYVKEYISVSTGNRFGYHKDLLYGSSTTLGGGIYNGNDQDNDLNYLISNSLRKIEPAASIYDGLLQLLKDCCTTIKTPLEFSQTNSTIGDVLLPFFFKEEYSDKSGMYHFLWGSEEDNSKVKSISVENLKKLQLKKTQNENSVFVLRDYCECPVILRPFTMRDIYMPFHLAFQNADCCCVFETINPNSDLKKEDTFVTLNGYYQQEIITMQFIPMGSENLKKLKKNMIVIDGNDGGGAVGSSVLILFQWAFDYYQNVFLKCDLNNVKKTRKYIPNSYPPFHQVQIVQKIKHAKTQDGSFENKYDEYNSSIFITETEDSLNECLRLIGKNLSTFIFSNDSYEFRVRGNLLRRPNEIIKLGYRGNEQGVNQQISMHTSVSMSDYTLMYIKRVTHHFQGSYYWNDILGGKVCEVLT